MKKIFFAGFIFSLLLTPCFRAEAQSSNSSSSPTTIVFDISDLPQWVKDMRRWDIIAFGSFPFSMFVVTFATDMFRWSNANGMDFSEMGRRYAPWPLKTAGNTMTNDEYTRTFLIAAGLSAVIALVDLIIVKIKQNDERRRIESLPSGTVNIDRRPYGNSEDEDSGGADDTTSGGE
jgi:hypothetical protein